MKQKEVDIAKKREIKANWFFNNQQKGEIKNSGGTGLKIEELKVLIKKRRTEILSGGVSIKRTSKEQIEINQ